jgi:8-oxo-dGTP pyrophosphatase MutT (NUDIX family)
MSILTRLLDHYNSESAEFDFKEDVASGQNSKSDRQAAVLMPVTDHLENPTLILTRRAKHLTTHAGQISFPGGMWEPGDSGLAQTALRESQEEIGLRPKDVQLVSRFAAKPSRFGVQVTPFLGVIPQSASLIACTEETDEIIPVPLAFFVDEKPERIDYRETNGVRYKLPSWRYQNQEVWGLTAMIIEELLRPLR